MGDKRKMTENEKIELFDKWYDENYDEWAEGEEGIALREELEQAFKSGIATLEKENAELKKKCYKKAVKDYCELEKENAELKKQLEMSNKVYNDNLDYSHHIEEQLTKAKEEIRSLYYIIQYRINYENNIEIADEMWRAEQFLKESE